jgi:hypothetical protein
VRGRKVGDSTSPAEHPFVGARVPVAAVTSIFRRERYHRRVRKLITWIVVTLGIAALVRKLKASRDVDELHPAPAHADPADELRRKLAETREDEMPVPGAPPTPEPTIEERRAEVHDQGRAAIEEMQNSGDD